MATRGNKNLEAAGYAKIDYRQGDGGLGLEKGAPYDRILVSCACPFIPKPLFDQLKEGGRIVAPVGDRHSQRMEIMKKVKGKPLKEEYMGGFFMFVPLVGAHGFDALERR